MKTLIFLFFSVVSARHVFVTLLSNDDYLPGVLTLVHSAILMGNAGEVPFIVMCVRGAVSPKSMTVLEDYAKVYSHSQTVKTIWINDFDQPKIKCKSSVVSPSRFNMTLAKLGVFDTSNYSPVPDRVVYLDADTMIANECVKDLFSSRLFLPPAFAHDILLPDTFNTGVMLIDPAHDHFAAIKAFANSITPNGCTYAQMSYDGGDQGVLNSFFRHEWNGENGQYEGWNAKHHLPFKYNALAQVSLLHPQEWDRIRPEICVIHFAGHVVKPFAKEVTAYMKKQANGSVLFKEQYSTWHVIYGDINIPSKPRVDLILQ